MHTNPTYVSVDLLANQCHSENARWWRDPKTGKDYREMPEVLPFFVGTKLMLVVTELSEAMEGYRKNLNDDKLPHRKAFEVELADALIRLFDLAGALQLDVAGAFLEKLQYNRTRVDHTEAHRNAQGGKAF